MNGEAGMKRLFGMFLEKLPEMLKHHYGKFALVGDRYPVQFWDIYESAAADGVRLYGLHEPFLVQLVIPQDTLVFNARPYDI